MYRIPLILGLLQITNLSLPITSPFTQASARYIIDGSKVTFESIEMRSKEMMMSGTGNLDFVTRQVQMTSSSMTDSTTRPKLPVIGDLIEGARHELLQIRVRGTLEEPKVSARAMNTLTTTVDEVLRGDEPPSSVQAAKRSKTGWLIRSGWDTQVANVGICIDCNYSLRGLNSNRCPECGRPFNFLPIQRRMNMGLPMGRDR